MCAGLRPTRCCSTATSGPPPTRTGAETKFPGFASTFRNYSGSLGAAYNLNERLTVKANLSRGFRAPNIAELGSNGQHEGTIRYEIGNDNLHAETSLQLDAGVSYVTDHVRFSVDAFENSISNYIYTRRLLTAGGRRLAARRHPRPTSTSRARPGCWAARSASTSTPTRSTGCTSKTRFRWCAPAS